MRKMGGLFFKIPFTGVMMWIGSLAIIGFPFFSGYYSKESILENAYFASSNIANYAYIIGIITALLTAFYSWRLLFMTFHGDFKSSKSISLNKKLDGGWGKLVSKRIKELYRVQSDVKEVSPIIVKKEVPPQSNHPSPRLPFKQKQIS